MNKVIFKLRVKFYFFRKKILYKSIQLRIYLDYVLNRFPKELENEVKYVLDNGIWVFPYPFTLNYISRKVPVFIEKKYPYVLFQGKKMYFKKSWDSNRVEKYFNDISCEQDIDSPHRYCDDFFYPGYDSYLIDIGAAEGNFSLENVEKVKRIFLFERNPNWIESLKLTFSDYMDRVKIIEKNVGINSLAGDISLDNMKILFGNELFIKIDADGGEQEVLKCMKKLLLQNQNIKVAICTYHKQNDFLVLDEILKSYGFKTEFTKNKMLFYFDKSLKFPYFRNGVLRASKSIIPLL